MRQYRARGLGPEGQPISFRLEAASDQAAKDEAKRRCGLRDMTLKRLFHIERRGVTNEIALA